MKRFSYAIAVAFVFITTNLHAYEPQTLSQNGMLRLPPTQSNQGSAGDLYPVTQTAAFVPYEEGAVSQGMSSGGHLVDASSFTPQFRCRDLWHLQVLPDSLLYQPYMASAHEERMAAQWVEDQNWGWIWDVALGGRVGILRYGNASNSQPEGWQVDLGGAAFPRLQLNRDLDVVSCDYKFSLPITYARGRHATRFGYYHLSSHLGDEYMIKNPGARRINYSRDCLMLGHSIYFHERKMRIYAEAAWAFQTGDMTKPWEFQFGFEYAPNGPTGLRPQPFFAIGGHLREEVDFGGNLIVQTGYLWQGDSGHRFRMGLQYYVGMSDQYEFIDQYENKVGFGIWYDF